MSETDWSRKTVLQLKGALTKRKLDTDGTKDELVQRLVQYEQDQFKSEEKMEVAEEVAVCKSHLTRHKIKDAYEASLALRTVIISPFQLEYLNDSNLCTWLNACQAYEIKKTAKPDIMAELKFDSIELGIEAFSGMQVECPDLELTRPKLSGLEYCFAAAKDKTWWSRLVVLEGLSPLINNEEKLKEYFPEAETVVPFLFEQSLAEFGVLEFSTIDAARDYVSCVGGEPIELDDVEVKVSMCNTYMKKAPPNEANETLMAQLKEIASKKVVLEDDARIDLYNEVVHLKDSVSQLSSMHISELNSMVKINESLKQLYQVDESLKVKKAQLLRDTELRKTRGDVKMPEPSDGDDELNINNSETANIEKELEDLNIQLEEAKREEKVIRGLILKCKQKLPPSERNLDLLKGKATGNSSSENTKSGEGGGERSEDLGCMVHVTNLPEYMPLALRKQLKDMFEKFGPVDRLFTLGKTATVTMLSEDDAKQATEEIDGTMFENKSIKISHVEPKMDQFTKKCEVFITNLPYNVEANKNMELTKIFMEIGPVAKVFAQNFQTHAFVTMSNEEDADRAVKELNGKMYRGKVLGVFERTEKAKNDAGTKRKKQGGFDNVVCYKCQGKGHYADKCWQVGVKKRKPDNADQSLAMIKDLSVNLNEKMRQLETIQHRGYPPMGNQGGPPGPPMHSSQGPPMNSYNQYSSPPGQHQGGGYYQNY